MPKEKFTCSYCDGERNYTSNFRLRRHVRQAHPGVDLPAVRRGRKPNTTETATTYTCDVCNEILQNKRAIHYHRKKHKTSNTRSKSIQWTC